MRPISFTLRPVYFQRKVPSVNTAMFRPVYFSRKAPSVNVTMKTWKRRSRIQTLSTNAGEITDSTARIILQICSNCSAVRRAEMHRVTNRGKLGTHLNLDVNFLATIIIPQTPRLISQPISTLLLRKEGQTRPRTQKYKMALYSVTSLAGLNRNKRTIKRHYDLKKRALVPAVGEGF